MFGTPWSFTMKLSSISVALLWSVCFMSLMSESQAKTLGAVSFSSRPGLTHGKRHRSAGIDRSELLALASQSNHVTGVTRRWPMPQHRIVEQGIRRSTITSMMQYRSFKESAAEPEGHSNGPLAVSALTVEAAEALRRSLRSARLPFPAKWDDREVLKSLLHRYIMYLMMKIGHGFREFIPDGSKLPSDSRIVDTMGRIIRDGVSDMVTEALNLLLYPASTAKSG
eukprot:scpid94845/ scgid35286/ 